jgi:hypothetical protein
MSTFVAAFVRAKVALDCTHNQGNCSTAIAYTEMHCGLHSTGVVQEDCLTLFYLRDVHNT